MKCDMELIRLILQQIEDRNPESSNPGVWFEGFSRLEVHYHLKLMEDDGLVEGVRLTSNSALCIRMTMDGHKFLGASREDRIWKKAKELAIKTTGSLTIAAVKAALTKVVVAAVTGAE